MPKQNFISVPVSNSVQAIFDDFVKELDITKTAALTDMIELYMIATDEDLYVTLKKKHLKVEGVKEVILSRNIELEETTSEDFLFMKLGWSSTANDEPINAIQTMKLYMKDEKMRGYTWFSTSALPWGMSKKQVKYFKKIIQKGEKLKILFAAGIDAGGDNDIVFNAEVLDIVSYKEPDQSPESNALPKEFTGEDATIWLKIKNIEPEEHISANQLKVKSTGSSLDKVISTSQFHFGYITRR